MEHDGSQLSQRNQRRLTEDNTLSPYDESRIAVSSGSGEESNPYADGTYHYAEWARGFHTAGDGSSADRAFGEGQLAASNHKDRGSNPYDDLSEEEAENAGRWFAGYDSVAETDDEGETADE